ncbi:tRNA-dihydrouridine synthase B [uncultured archaeon]|nr:tRNA-dihydrouridine synthase B [uncultured archaeon]
MRQGIGAAMVKRVTRTSEIAKLIRKHGFECSVKLRLGLDKYEKEKGAYLNLIENVEASFFVVHTRTARQTLDNGADFSVYPKCVETGKPIIANGDIKTRAQVEKLRSEGLSGAMIGRAAIENPEIFRKLRLKD